MLRLDTLINKETENHQVENLEVSKDRIIAFTLLSAALGYRLLNCLIFGNYIVTGSDVMQNIKLGRHLPTGDFYGVLDTYWTPLYPFLIGIVTYFVDSLVTPSIIISIAAGSLAAPVTYYLVKQFYGRREGIIAGILAGFYPFLLNSTISLGTENLYLIWVISAVTIGWRGLKTESVADYLKTGLLIGLAYLTRPEAIGYPLFFISVIFIKNLWQKKLFDAVSMRQVCALILGFSIFAAPYIFYLRAETGSWMVSGKLMRNLSAGYLEDDPKEDTPNKISTAEISKTLITNFALSLREVDKSVTTLLPILMMVFAALGFFGRKWNKQRFKREAYLIFFCAITICGYALTVVLDRYFYVLLPITFGWIACGIIELKRWFYNSFRHLLPNKYLKVINSKTFAVLCLLLIYVYVFPINFFVRSSETLWQGAGFEERAAGLWLKEYSNPSPTIFSAGFRPVFYAEGKQIWNKTTDMNELMGQLKNSEIDYVITSERYYKYQPQLANLTEILQNNPKFELVYRKNEYPGYEISIFKLK